MNTSLGSTGKTRVIADKGLCTNGEFIQALQGFVGDIQSPGGMFTIRLIYSKSQNISTQMISLCKQALWGFVGGIQSLKNIRDKSLCTQSTAAGSNCIHMYILYCKNHMILYNQVKQIVYICIFVCICGCAVPHGQFQAIQLFSSGNLVLKHSKPFRNL